MMLDVSSSTYTPSLDHLLALNQQFEERSATDISSPAKILTWLTQTHNISLQGTKPSTTSNITQTPEIAAQNVSTKTFDWLSYALASFHELRGARDGWNGEGYAAPTEEALIAAEELSIFIAPLISARRPTCSIDPDGCPTIAARGKDFYLHLTVERERSEKDHALLSWYAVINKKEYFADGVEFSGLVLPSMLFEVLQADFA